VKQNRDKRTHLRIQKGGREGREGRGPKTVAKKSSSWCVGFVARLSKQQKKENAFAGFFSRRKGKKKEEKNKSRKRTGAEAQGGSQFETRIEGEKKKNSDMREKKSKLILINGGARGGGGKRIAEKGKPLEPILLESLKEEGGQN